MRLIRALIAALARRLLRSLLGARTAGLRLTLIAIWVGVILLPPLIAITRIANAIALKPAISITIPLVSCAAAIGTALVTIPLVPVALIPVTLIPVGIAVISPAMIAIIVIPRLLIRITGAAAIGFAVAITIVNRHREIVAVIRIPGSIATVPRRVINPTIASAIATGITVLAVRSLKASVDRHFAVRLAGAIAALAFDVFTAAITRLCARIANIEGGFVGISLAGGQPKRGQSKRQKSD